MTLDLDDLGTDPGADPYQLTKSFLDGPERFFRHLFAEDDEELAMSSAAVHRPHD